jgi:alkanesulfonate monooxygenase SsuD/methylene tetrahydromethanopterin reductase-like flavin-dependent oxidoreductase (luciferase family)
MPVRAYYYVQKPKKLEEGEFDLIFFADASHIGPVMITHYLRKFERVSILFAFKHGEFLLSTIDTSYADLFTVTRQMASLDKISNGRAGWNAVTSNPEGLVNYSRTHLSKGDLLKGFSFILKFVRGVRGKGLTL